MRRIATYRSARDPIMEASASLWTYEATLLSAALMLISTRRNNAELLALSLSLSIRFFM